MANPGSREGAGALVSNSVQRAIQEREHQRLRASGQLHREAMMASMTRSEMVDLWRMQDPAGNAPVKLDEFTGAGICSAPRDQREGQPPYGHDAQMDKFANLTWAPRPEEFSMGEHDFNSSQSGMLSKFSNLKLPKTREAAERVLTTTNFADMAESSTGGGGGISRPYGTFVAGRRGDGCSLWQRLPMSHSQAASLSSGVPCRYDYFPGSAMPVRAMPHIQHNFDHRHLGRNVSAANIAKRAFLSRRATEGGVHVSSKVSYHGRDKVLGDETNEETGRYKQPRASSLCPPECKPGCWMCFRKAENIRETFTFLTDFKGNEVPLPEPTIYDRFGRPLPKRPPPEASPPPDILDNTKSAPGAPLMDFSHYQLPPEYLQQGAAFYDFPPPPGAPQSPLDQTSSFKKRLGESIMGSTMPRDGGRRYGGLPQQSPTRSLHGSLPREHLLPTPALARNSARNSARSSRSHRSNRS